MGEVHIAALLCGLLMGGETEVRHKFPNTGKTRAIRVDCETPTHVIEIGLDKKASARDSVHQAMFAAHLTGKKPMVIIIDRDGREGRYEYELRVVAGQLGIAFGTCRKGFVQRWAQTSLYRGVDLGQGNDLPVNGAAKGHCDLSGEFDPPVMY